MNNSGIYKIVNLITGKYYVGSTKSFETRKTCHFSRLRNNNHTNQHLQNAYNKYGKDSFIFEIIEYVEEELLLDIEQSYLDNFEISKVYNKTQIAGAGGYDALSIPVFLLDLNGDIVNEFTSVSETSRFLNKKRHTHSINNGRIVSGKYRIVSVEFYNSNLELIKSWKSYSNQTLENKKNYILRRMVICNGKEYSSKEELEKELPITRERIRQIIVSGNSKKYDIKYKYPELQK